MKILLIEDDAEIRSVFRESLEIDDHHVTEAADGVLALDAIDTDPPDLIISDVRMPRMGGDELFNKLRNTETDIQIPFIFLSGNTTDDEIISRLNDGAELCLTKPIRPSLLRAHVNSCLSKYERFSDYMAGKLDKIAESMPQDIERDFKSYRSLFSNLQRYADIVVNAVKHAEGKSESVTSTSNIDSPFEGSVAENRIAFVRLCLREFVRRRALVPDTAAETLTWQLIFLVAEAQMSNQKLFVSDLYVTATSAKTTTNNRINSLVGNGVFEKRPQDSDGRRQSISLTKSFTRVLEDHIDETVQNVLDIFHK